MAGNKHQPIATFLDCQAMVLQQLVQTLPTHLSIFSPKTPSIAP
jgi:hypothetical protein